MTEMVDSSPLCTSIVFSSTVYMYLIPDWAIALRRFWAVSASVPPAVQSVPYTKFTVLLRVTVSPAVKELKIIVTVLELGSSSKVCNSRLFLVKSARNYKAPSSHQPRYLRLIRSIFHPQYYL